ncbi:hypothetical protein CesoFtcFv8_015599 [Champsocephalus esox]|uniref:Uncharacterized protein n=1 Tax=Champsocephalus esox TaxID=159716 RepID=A0AAN8BSH1_9TELE|nr:hypothetical protein CesoFtcFv8_015599 [Champsocephalus esox]
MRFVAVSPLPSVIGTPYGFKEERREKGRKDKTFLDWSLETTFMGCRFSQAYFRSLCDFITSMTKKASTPNTKKD